MFLSILKSVSNVIKQAVYEYKQIIDGFLPAGCFSKILEQERKIENMKCTALKIPDVMGENKCHI